MYLSPQCPNATPCKPGKYRQIPSPFPTALLFPIWTAIPCHPHPLPIAPMQYVQNVSSLPPSPLPPYPSFLPIVPSPLKGEAHVPIPRSPPLHLIKQHINLPLHPQHIPRLTLLDLIIANPPPPISALVLPPRSLDFLGEGFRPLQLRRSRLRSRRRWRFCRRFGGMILRKPRRRRRIPLRW